MKPLVKQHLAEVAQQGTLTGNATPAAEELTDLAPDSGQLSRLYDALSAMLARSKARLLGRKHDDDDPPCQDALPR